MEIPTPHPRRLATRPVLRRCRLALLPRPGQAWLVFVAVLAAIPVLPSVTGTGLAWADDIQVNTYTTNKQKAPSVSRDADGDFVVVWQSLGSGGNDSSSYSVPGKRYSSDGSTTGGQFQVNTYTTEEQEEPSVAMNADSDFVVVWHSDGSAGTDTFAHSIQGQRYASDGSAAGAQFQVNTYTTVSQIYPSVAMNADGDFVVVWAGSGSAGTTLV